MKPGKSLKQFIELATSVLYRIDVFLPEKKSDMNWDASAFQWERIGRAGLLHPLPHPHTFPLTRLAAIDDQMARLVQNTEQFLHGRSANNALLTGARGTGKSSLIKALLHEYAKLGLRLIEVDKYDLLTLPALLPLLKTRPEKFIIFCDDLSFEEGDDGYKSLKTVLDGSLSVRASNVLIYATSNRRHLMPELMKDNLPQYTDTSGSAEIHPQETVEEKTSLSDRFGLWLSFYPFDQDAYLQAVENWLKDAGLELNEESRRAALAWSLARGSRSGRVAWQFVCDWAGRLP